jgi:hypothetical protein
MPAEILTLVGSLRAASINRQLAELAAESAPDGVTLTIYEGLDELPFYNEDIDPDSPAGRRRTAGRGGRRRRGSDRHAGKQRHHPRRAEERARLALAPVGRQ